MAILKPYTFVAGTKAKANEVNANFDTVYAATNTIDSKATQNAADIEALETNKADKNGNSSNRFAVADAVNNSDAVNKQTLMKALANSLDYISGLLITKDSGNPEDTILVSAGSCYDSGRTVILINENTVSKQNLNQAANGKYYVYIIGTNTGNLTDILISTSSDVPSLPSGYTKYRLLGYYTTNEDAEIYAIYNMSSDGTVRPSAAIVDVYVNDTSGYILYSNNYIEQWGHIAPSPGYTEVTLLKEFANTKYQAFSQTVNIAVAASPGFPVSWNSVIINSTTTISVYVFNQGDGSFWRAYGYAKA